MSLITPKTALISLSDKSNLDELIKFLLDQKNMMSGPVTKVLVG